MISLRVDTLELESGHTTTREVVEHPGAVAVLAWSGTHLAMVRQWRHPAGRELLEVPAGTIDPDERPIETASRELREETGIDAAAWLEGPSFYTAPGFCTERLTLFLATELRDGTATGPPDEIIDVSWLDLDAALRAAEDGTVMDAKSLFGILWLARRLGR
ncbi:MAG: NUDIX hydrolase [Chloroflexota bacterium]|nr:NUDIX hydrolase [Chloroflexota bacterium]